jgi:UrcA family protein
MKRAILCAALAASALMGAMTAAHAEDGQMRVNLDGINLSTSEGARIALARIESQAGNFCDVSAGRQSLERTGLVQRCLSDMTHKSVAQLNAPMVTALLGGRSLDAQPAVTVALAQK